MPDELKDANLPQGDNWNPPGGEDAFDDLFGGAGDGSSDISQVAEPAPAADSTAQPESTPPDSTPPQQSQPPADPEFLRAEGIVYKTREDAIRGIQEKNRRLDDLRRMVESVTGADPLKKSNQSQADISYMKDSARYVQDKSRAVEIGQRTGNWDLYRDVEAKLQREQLQELVGPYVPAIQNVGKQQALDAIELELPGFKKFYGTEAYHSILESRPKLRMGIESYENGPASAADLKELYQIAWDTNQSRAIPELLKRQNTPPHPTPPRMPLSGSQMAPPQPRSSSAPSMNTSLGRKALMAELEARGVLDKNF